VSEAVFVRVLDAFPEAKGDELHELLGRLRSSDLKSEEIANIFAADTSEFSVVPGSPFAYWVGEPIRRMFREFPPLEGNVATVKQGLATADDFRFVRAWWEVRPERIGYSAEDCESGRGWIHFAKGGSYSPYYADVHLVVNWFGKGAEIKNRINAASGKPKSNVWMLRQTEEDCFFRPGLTWPLRSQKGFSVRAYPDGCVFGHKGPAVLPKSATLQLTLLGLMNTRLVLELVSAQMAFGSYEVGVIQRTPVPGDVPFGDVWQIASVFDLVRNTSVYCETIHAFRLPSLVVHVEDSADLEHISRRVESDLSEGVATLVRLTAEIERHVHSVYGFETSSTGKEFGIPESVQRSGSGATGDTDEEVESSEDSTDEDLAARVASLLMWGVGVALGRWDVRMARDGSLIPELQESFDRLPCVAPGGLVGPDGFPGTEERIASEAWLRARPNVITLPEPGSFEGPDSITAAEYPIAIAWDGILVDDPGHPRDIARKVREVLSYVYGDRAGEIEEEALEILRGDGRTPRTLRDWFRNQKATALGKNFFDFHIQRYSKSRRKAPIYWRLCSSPGRGQSQYGVWLYYHRLTDDTLWTVLNEYVRPKVELEERRLAELRAERERGGGGGVRQVEKEIEEKVELLEELEWFQRELKKVAERGYAPDLDDGVIINMAPLHELVPWKEAAKVWGELGEGEYDWSKLAMRYWPERVEAKCREDKSFAIAHDRLDLLLQDER